MNGYQKIKEQNAELKHQAEYQTERATVYILAMLAHIDKKSEQFQKIQETAKYLFNNYPNSDHHLDPLLTL